MINGNIHHYQKTMFVANPGEHQMIVPNRRSTAFPVKLKAPAGGSTPGKVASGSHQRVIPAHETTSGPLTRNPGLLS